MTNETIKALTDSLLWHLETRNWARKKLADATRATAPQDIRICHHLYLDNAFAAIDLVAEYYREERFIDLVRANLAKSGDLDYARELRSAVFHRDISMDSPRLSESGSRRSLCPDEVFSHDGRRRHVCSFAYTDDLARALDLAANLAMIAVLEASDLLTSRAHAPDRESTLAAIGAAPNMPEYAKAWVGKTLRGPDGDRVIAELAEARVRRLRGLLTDPTPP